MLLLNKKNNNDRKNETLFGMIVPNAYICTVNKKERIMEAAIHLIVRCGEYGSPMSLISKEAGTGMGTIYNYFSSKEELINDCMVYIRNKQAAEVKITVEDGMIKHQILEFFRKNTYFLLNNPHYFFFLDQYHFSPIIREEVRMKSFEYYSPLYVVGMDAVKKGIIKDMPGVELYNFCLGGLRNCISFTLYYNLEINDSLIDRHLSLVWDAIKA